MFIQELLVTHYNFLWRFRTVGINFISFIVKQVFFFPKFILTHLSGSTYIYTILIYQFRNVITILSWILDFLFAIPNLSKIILYISLKFIICFFSCTFGISVEGNCDAKWGPYLHSTTGSVLLLLLLFLQSTNITCA